VSQSAVLSERAAPAVDALPTFASTAAAVASAEALAPRIRARVPEAEALRRLPDATVDELVASGLLRVLVPHACGGSELNYDTVLDVTAVLAAACPSTGWVYALWAAHMWMVAQFPADIQAELFGGRGPLVSSVVNTVGTITAVDGGYRWTGKGFFSSGVDHCTWMTPALESTDLQGVTERRWFLIPRAQIQIVDDWYTMGLKATGSKTIIVDDVFIPDSHVLATRAITSGTAPGAALHAGPLYHAASDFTYSLPLAMPAIGAARAFLAAFEDKLRTKLTGSNPLQVADAQALLPQLALASADVDAAYAVLQRDSQLYCTAPAAQFGELERVRCRRDTAYCAQLCRRAVNSLFQASGGTAIFESSDLQRLWRDVNATAAHHGLNWDLKAPDVGRALLGLPTSPPPAAV
jgi:3-hydroxy-9,10-secoandrosta-1,3,5(10)-triene-9,17-dione monooxygenase